MTKKTLTWITLASFLIFSWSCAIYSSAKRPLQSIKPEERGKVKVSAVQTKSGEKIELRKHPAARIKANSVVGEKLVKDIVVEKSKIKTLKKLPTWPPYAITSTDEVSYRVINYNEKNDKIIFDAYVPTSILLSDIDLVWIRKVNVPATLLLYSPAIILGLFAIALSGAGTLVGAW
jgi:hypothetical protein